MENVCGDSMKTTRQLSRISEALVLRSSKLLFKRYFYPLLRTERVVIILKGARGIGKTTSMLQYLFEKKEKGHRVFYLSTDTTLLQSGELFSFVEEHVDRGVTVFALDEIHKIADWDLQLKTLYDSFPDITFLASGSSSLQLSRADLSRRALEIPCVGLSFREWLFLSQRIRLTDNDLQVLTLTDIVTNHERLSDNYVKQFSAQGVSVVDLFHEYLTQGYYPTFLEIKAQWALFETIRQSVNKTIEQDILTCYPDLTGKSIQRLLRLLKFLAVHCPFTPDLKKLKESLEISDEKTLKQYLYFLHEAQIIREMAQTGNRISALTKPEKIFLHNPTLLAALSEGTPDPGTIRETFVALALEMAIVMEGYQLEKEQVTIPRQGDFQIGEKVFEVGGRNKSFSQIKATAEGWILADDIMHGDRRKIPLWLLGFLW